MSLSGKLYDLIADKPVSPHDLDRAALFVLDTLAGALAGSATRPGHLLLKWGQGAGEHDAGRRAFLVGAASHILEMDDLHRASVVHPGCAVVPAAWALAEKNGNDGRAMLKAVLWGYEAATRVGMAVGPAHYRIFHNTATCGPFGSAMAAAAGLGLSRGQAVDALGNAGTQAAGLWQFLDTGAMSKHLHAGRAAEAGVVAGELAALGFSGAPEILEGEKGFFVGLAPEGGAAMVLAEPDAPWQLHLTSIKPWPSCRHTHPAIDAAQEVGAAVKARGAGQGDIEAVEVATYQAALNLCDRAEPKSVYEAKFSLQHTVAAALLGVALDLSAFGDEARAETARLRRQISLRADKALEAAYPAHWGARVTVRLKAGEEISAARRDARGDPELPMSHGEIVEKARALMKGHGHRAPDSFPDAFIEAVLALPGGGPLPRLELGAAAQFV